MSRINEIRARLAAATPGPWYFSRNYAECHGERCAWCANPDWHQGTFTHESSDGPVVRHALTRPDWRLITDAHNHELKENDGKLIANAPTDLAWALKIHETAVQMAYEYAEEQDYTSELGCGHTVEELKAGGRLPRFEGDTFEPLNAYGNACRGYGVLAQWLPKLGEKLPQV